MCVYIANQYNTNKQLPIWDLTNTRYTTQTHLGEWHHSQINKLTNMVGLIKSAIL